MGGAIEAESKVGKGTTFRVTLDLPAAADDAETEEHTETAITLPEKPLTVLVAEDNDLTTRSPPSNCAATGCTVCAL